MSIKPILFNTDMVRAILDGRKTVTRRVIKPNQYNGEIPMSVKTLIDGKELMCEPWKSMTDFEIIKESYKSPYQPGDILYVRETWRLMDFDCIDTDWSASVQYKADMTIGERWHNLSPDEHIGWRPSIHMPKEAARIWLRVTDARMERLQEITVEGINNEGVDVEPPPICTKGYPSESERDAYEKLNAEDKERYIYTMARHTYIGWCGYADNLFKKWETVWDSTIPKKDLPLYGFNANPWVTVTEFERIEK